jgi:hypothetical protein
MKTKRPNPSRAKKHLEKLREMIAKNPPPIYKLSEEEIIEKLRKTREEIWKEKIAIRH